MRVLLLLPGLISACIAMDSWPRFRGENGAGLSRVADVPESLTAANCKWTVSLPGSGSSSPVVLGGRVFVTGEDRAAGTMTVVCLSTENGREEWSRTFKVGEYHLHQFNNTAAGTPCLAENRVVVPWYDAAAEDERLTALDFSGRTVWEVGMGAFVGEHGPNINPVAAEGRVIAAFLHDGGGSTTAYSLDDGKILWSTPYPGGDKASYSTPLVRKGEEGREVVITGTAIGVMGLDFETGRERWSLPGILGDRAICSPIELLAGGDGASRLQIGCKNNVFRVVRPPAAGAGPEVMWSLKKQAPYVPAPVARDGVVYILAEGGTITAAEVLSGKVKWTKRLPGNFYASPVMAGDRLYCLSREGGMFVVPVGGEKAGEPVVSDLSPGPECRFTDATPAFSEGRIYVRMGARLDCYGK